MRPEIQHLKELTEGLEEEITRRLDGTGDKERVIEARQAILDYVEELLTPHMLPIEQAKGLVTSAIDDLDRAKARYEGRDAKTRYAHKLGEITDVKFEGGE